MEFESRTRGGAQEYEILADLRQQNNPGGYLDTAVAVANTVMLEPANGIKLSIVETSSL
jgi:hypothetical protein